ncbi:MAG: hypothetical protein ACI83B_001715, partial [Sediminicola sp.]
LGFSHSLLVILIFTLCTLKNTPQVPSRGQLLVNPVVTEFQRIKIDSSLFYFTL